MAEPNCIWAWQHLIRVRCEISGHWEIHQWCRASFGDGARGRRRWSCASMGTNSQDTLMVYGFAREADAALFRMAWC